MRNLTLEMAAEFAGPSVKPIMLAELFFDSGTLRLWTGYGQLEWGDREFTGIGTLIGISPIQETQEIQARGIVVTLNGISSTVISLALSERSRGRPFRLYLGSVDTRRYVATESSPGAVKLEDGTGYVLLENQLIDSPYRIFSGLMDTMEFSDSGDKADIRLSVENILITGQRSKVSRYTMEDQRKRFPNDRGLEFINALQDKQVIW